MKQILQTCFVSFPSVSVSHCVCMCVLTHHTHLILSPTNRNTPTLPTSLNLCTFVTAWTQHLLYLSPDAHKPCLHCLYSYLFITVHYYNIVFVQHDQLELKPKTKKVFRINENSLFFIFILINDSG